MLKSIASGIVMAALVTPALADEYWVVQDSSTQQCSVVEKKSSGTATDTTNGSAASATKTYIGSAFPTRAEAKDAMDRMRKCGIAE
jgi:hypothetical protein